MFPEPLVSFLVLDYRKPEETRKLLESIKQHAKFNHKVIYLHNGNEKHTYPQDFLNERLIDQLIITADNDGLGIGTRNLFAACFSPYVIYAQNDQFMNRDFSEQELMSLISYLDKDVSTKDNQNIKFKIKSISLAGAPCGFGVYSERAHLIAAESYFEWEHFKGLPHGGAGPFHNLQWREEAIQKIYAQNQYIHFPYESPVFADNGKTAVRQNPDGSVWKHLPDTKRLWLIRGPVREKFIYPKFTDEEWDLVLTSQKWPDGQIPEKEKEHSFVVWDKEEK